MGYARNHLATIVTGAFALVLTGIWGPMVEIRTRSKFCVYHVSFNYMVYGTHLLVISKKAQIMQLIIPMHMKYTKKKA